MRRFYFYGPVDCEEHFCVPRKGLVQECLEQLIGYPDKGGHYFKSDLRQGKARTRDNSHCRKTLAPSQKILFKSKKKVPHRFGMVILDEIRPQTAVISYTAWNRTHSFGAGLALRRVCQATA